MDKEEKYYSLITGASSGIGKAVAEELARRYRNLLLIALPDTGLDSLCRDLSLKYNIISLFFEIDLRERDAVGMILSFVRHESLRINLLVNNIGIGRAGRIGDFPPKRSMR